MAERAALITGGSSGIGLAIARALGQDGYALTVSARRPEKLEEAVKGLKDEGLDVEAVPANMAKEEDITALADAHKESRGRLDVLVNNAGVGIAGLVGDQDTKRVDMQIGVNLRAVQLMTREVIPLLKEAGNEHHKALVVNVASMAGKFPESFLATYSATKAGVVALSYTLHGELAKEGVQVSAFCPAFVDTPMTDWVQEQVPKEEMIRPEDIAEAVRFLLRTSPACVVPEMMFIRPSDTLGGGLSP
jgi:short-subunit dehydrogenase